LLYWQTRSVWMRTRFQPRKSQTQILSPNLLFLKRIEKAPRS
jgi:hypothetical protein